jgi:hypothetical protein
MAAMVHRRPLAEQIAFPGLSALRSEPFFCSRFGLGLLGLGVLWVFHGFLTGRRFEVLTVVIDDGSWWSITCHAYASSTVR